MVIGPIQFASPLWLLLIPVLVALAVWFSRRSLSGLGAATRYVALAIRCLVIVGLCAILAEPNIRREGAGVALVVVLDGSASMPLGATDDVVASLEEMLTGAGMDDRLGVVTVAEQAFARTLPRDSVRPDEALRDTVRSGDLDPGPREGTDLADGLRMAMTVMPSDAATRILLISDGNETADSAVRAAERARALGVPIDVIPVVQVAGAEVVFDELAAPASARQGQTVSVTALLRTNKPQGVRGRLSLSVNGREYDFTPGEPGSSMPIVLEQGVNPFTIPVTLSRGGPQRFRARFDPDNADDDVVAQNNIAQNVTFVQSEGRVLVYTVAPYETEPFIEALTSSEIGVDTLLPTEGPHSIEEYQKYDAVVLFDTPAASFDRRQQEQLAQYVRDTGGGLLMVGGPNGFGAGGWIDSPVEATLPVRLDVPERRNMPKGALAIVVDTSGSMASGIQGTNLTALDAAEEGSVAAVTALSRLDQVLVLRFDTTVSTVVPLQEVGEKQSIFRRIRAMSPGGGTSMYPALRKAMTELKNADVAVRHIVVLSDGQTMEAGSLQAILDDAVANDISISGFSIGAWANDPLMSRLATSTGGLFHVVQPTANGLAEMVQLFVKEAQIVKRALIWEGDPFNPVLTGAPSVPLRSIPTPIPAIEGYVVTTDREGLSVVTMRSPEPENDPILAQWQHGLGRVVAFTSDATTRWASRWVEWGAYRAFWEQHVRWAMRPTGSANLSVVTTNNGPRTKVTVNALDQEGEPLNFARFVARVIGPDNQTLEMSLPQAAPGRYEGWFDSSRPGSHLVTVAYELTDADQLERGTIQAAVTRPFSDEFKRIEPDPGLLTRLAEMTGGRVLSEPQRAGASLFDSESLTQPVALRPVWLAFALVFIALFLSDVAVRRVRISPREILSSMKRAVKKTQHQATQIDALKAARKTTQARLTRTASVETKQAAKAKFEASPEHKIESPVVTAAPPAERKRPVGDTDDQANPKEEQDGMSRLLAAKRRAHAQHDED